MLEESGSPGRTRTTDKLINSQPLYQLSYRGIAEALRSARFSKNPEFKSRTRVSASHGTLDPPDRILECIHACGKRESQIAWRSEGRSGHQRDFCLIQQHRA